MSAPEPIAPRTTLPRGPRGPDAARGACAPAGGGAPDTPGWTVRAVPNRYPALVQAPAPEAEASPDLFAAQPAEGAHGVIVNAPEPVHSLSDLPVQVAAAVETWRARMRARGTRRAG